MMGALYKEEGANLRVDVLREPEVLDFIDTHASLLDSTFADTKMSDRMRQDLQRCNWVFSGMKTFHELHEAFPSLLDEDGTKKTFERFLKDVQRVDKTYNEHYLRAEYNFVTASAQAAADWERYEAEGDRYHLQYRTASDDRVREEHRALHGITLPPSDAFWDTHYPPNGWNCRCRVVQVRKSKHAPTPHKEVQKRVEENERNQRNRKTDMFRFNAGKQRKTVPDYNPYTIQQCTTCPMAKGKGKMALAFVPSNEVCAGCAIAMKCYHDKQKSKRAKLRKHYEYTLKQTFLNNSVNKNVDGQAIKVKFLGEGLEHLVDDVLRGRTKALELDDLLNIDKILENSTYIGEADYYKHNIRDAQRMLYFVAKVRGKEVLLNVAQRVRKKRKGKEEVDYILYSASKRKQ